MSVINLYLNSDLKKYLNINNNLDLLDKSELNKIFDYFINLKGELYRQVKSRKTIKVNLNQDYFIKIYKPIRFLEIIKNFLSFNWPFSSALDERNAILAVQKLNIKTLDIAGFGIKSERFAQTSFLITKAIEPNISLDKYIEQEFNNKDFFKFKRQLIKFIAQTTRKLHNNGLNHRDYYAGHYLLKTDSAIQVTSDNITSKILNSLYLIDLHRMQIRQKVPNRYLIKDLSSMLFSIRHYNFTMTDYLRFVKYYSDDYNLKFYRKNINFWKKILTKAKKIREKG